ncbi:hypothetical protein [Dorea sp.]
MNEKDIAETSKDNNEDISSSKVSDVEEKEENTQEVQTSEPEQQAQTQDYTELVEQVQYINQRLDTMTNVLIVTMIALGMVLGIIACDIFSRYFRS